MGCRDKRLLFHIPNGGYRRLSTGIAMKKAGLRPGVPDLFLAIPAGGKNGLFIEMKRLYGGVLSQSQKEMISLLEGQGYACAVCHGWIEARNAIAAYLSVDIPSFK